ncbi:alkaline phosphatase family protein, partial [Halobium palmae]
MVGFDALDFRHDEAFAEELPNFAALRDEGVEAPLESTFPPWTGSAWPSMYTGVDPSHHGVYSFFDYGDGYPDEARPVSRNEVDAPALWNYLSARGEPSVVMNVPITHPAESIEGVLFPGYLASEDEPSSPPSAREDLEERLGEPYRIYAEHELAKDRKKKVDSYVDLVDHRRRAAVALLEDHDWTLGFVQVQKTDSVFHSSPDREDHRRVYEAADELLGAVREVAGDDTNVIVCSDHGMKALSGYQVYPNELLEREGFVETVSGTSGASLPEAKSRLVNGESADPDAETESSTPTLADRAASTLLSGLTAAGVPPGRLYTVAQRAGLEPLVRRLVPKSFLTSANRGVNWRESRAYCRAGSELGVRVNLEGRERDGVVPESEYESVRDELIELFEALETPEGEPVFEWVKRREEVYDGPYTEDAADVLFMPADLQNVVMTSVVGTLFADTAAYGHALHGTFVADGPSFDALDAESLSLTDVTP